MRTLIIIPTYLEAENIADVLGKVRAVAPEADILVVDDASPDGTADLARAANESLGRVDVVVRTGKGGLAGAYRAGFQRAFTEGYEVVAPNGRRTSAAIAGNTESSEKYVTPAAMARRMATRTIRGKLCSSWASAALPIAAA